MELLRDLISVSVVLGLAAFAAYWLRKRAPNRKFRWAIGTGRSSRIRLIQRLALTPQHWMCVVLLDETEWILAVHPHGITVLQQSPARLPRVPVANGKESVE